MQARVLLYSTAIGVAGIAAPIAHARADQDVRVRAAGAARDGSVAASVVTEERLRAPGLRMAEVLRPVPGVAVMETGGLGAPASVSVRGATAAQTPVYLGGVRLNDDVAGTADLSLVPPWAIERVEVYRGHAPVQADPLGIGGAIFLEPRRPRRSELRAGGVVGSFGTRGAWTTAAVRGEAASVLAGVRIERADNDYAYADDRGLRLQQPQLTRTGRRTNADATAIDVAAMGRVATGRASHVQILYHAVGREQGLPGLALLPTEAARARLTRELAAVSSVTDCSGRHACTLQVSFSALLGRASYRDPLREAAIASTAAELDASRLEQGAFASVAVSDDMRVSGAVRGAVETLRADARGEALLLARRASGRASLLAEWDATWALTLRVLGSMAAQETSLATGGRGLAARGDEGAQPSGRVGVEVRSGTLTALANAGLYARTPTLAELYGLTGSVRGNPSLASEGGWTADVGGRASTRFGDSGHARLELFVFVRGVRDLVSYLRSSIGYTLPYNVGRARLVGIEAAATLEPWPFLAFELAATALDARDTSPGRSVVNDILPHRSRLVLAPRVELRAPAVPSLRVDGASIGLAYYYQSSRFVDPAGLVVLPAQGSLDAEAQLAWSGTLGVRARAVNLLDAARVDLLGLPLPGRALYVALEVTWP